jgi:P4 family phage/plasmid primase-like protien
MPDQSIGTRCSSLQRGRAIQPGLPRSSSRPRQTRESRQRTSSLTATRTSWRVLNGVVDLTTGHVKPLATESGLPNHWCTKLVPCEYDPDAKSELWQATLKRLFVDGELVELFRLFVGYSITGVSTEEKSLWMYGDTGNGKSTVLTAIRNALGPEYVGVAHEDLLVKASGKHDDIKAHIVDKRLVIAIETDESPQLDERLFKALTGGDVINARQLYEQSNDYKPVWKIVLATNHLPDIKNFDDAIRRRLLIVPTAETVPENQRVPYLKQVLAQEEHAKAILAWAIRGARDWYAELVRNTYDPTKPRTGLVVPEVVRLAIDQYQQDNAPLHQNWLDQRWMITWSADDKINTADVWDDFDGWAKQKRITEKIGKQKFFKWLQSLDGVSRSDNGRFFTGLRLKTASYSFQF